MLFFKPAFLFKLFNHFFCFCSLFFPPYLLCFSFLSPSLSLSPSSFLYFFPSFFLLSISLLFVSLFFFFFYDQSFYDSASTFLATHNVSTLDGVILTHDHADAILGLDDLRSFTLTGIQVN